MDRRSFLKNSALGGTAAAAATLAAPAYAQGNRTLTLVTTWGRGLAGVHDAAQRAADSITAMSGGSLTIDLKAAGELVGAFEVFDAVTSGQAEMYHGADYYFVNQHPGYAFFTSVPFGMTPQEISNWYYNGEGQSFHDELLRVEDSRQSHETSSSTHASRNQLVFLPTLGVNVSEYFQHTNHRDLLFLA